MKRVMVYKRYERFWHWLQALLIITLMVTGFDIHHSAVTLFDFRLAHQICAWTLIVLIAFTIFWHVITGEWQQYVPTRHNVGSMIRFYLIGIFRREPHPVTRTPDNKLNPLQRLVYSGLKVLIIPVMVTSGLILIFYNDLIEAGYRIPLGVVANIHTVGAFGLTIFLVGHMYLITTGHSPLANIRAMVTGYDDEITEQPNAAAAERGA